MAFTHPLARGARIWTAHVGAPKRMLVVVTTLELDPNHKGYKKKLVDDLSAAAAEYLSSSGGADGYCLINRLREWGNR